MTRPDATRRAVLRDRALVRKQLRAESAIYAMGDTHANEYAAFAIQGCIDVLGDAWRAADRKARKRRTK